MRVIDVRQTLDLLTWLGCVACPRQILGEFNLQIVTANVNIEANNRYRIESETVLQSSPQTGIQSSSISEGDTLKGNEVFRIRGNHMVTAIVPAGGTTTPNNPDVVSGTETRMIAHENAESVVWIFQHGRLFRVPEIVPLITEDAPGREYVTTKALPAMMFENNSTDQTYRESTGESTALRAFTEHRVKNHPDHGRMGLTGQIAISAPPAIGSGYKDDDVFRLPINIPFVATAYSYPSGEDDDGRPIKQVRGSLRAA